MAIQAFFARFSIAHRLWVGFGLVLGILALTILIAWGSLFSTRARVNTVINKIQPAVLASTALMNEIKTASTALGFYLLTQEDLHKNAYVESLATIDQRLAELRKSLTDMDDAEAQASLDAIGPMIDKFKQYQSTLFEIATQQNKNYAALGYAAQNINPLSQEFLQAISGMIMAEETETANEKRRKLLFAAEDVRYNWANVMSNLRVYVVFGNPDVFANMKLFVDGAGKSIKRLHDFKGLLNFEQEEALSNIDDHYQRLTAGIAGLEKIFKGDKARMDAYLIREEIGPLVREIDAKVNALVNEQRARIMETSVALGQQITFATALMALLLVAGLGVGLAVSWAMSAMIAQPLKKAAYAMQDIARGDGDLTRRLNKTGSDEIATLSDAFNQFAENIRNVVLQVGGATDQVSNAANGMRSAIGSAIVACGKQKTSTEEIVAAIHQMSASAQEIARSAEGTANAARDADGETNAGQSVVADAVRAINSLADETQSTAAVIQRLGSDIQSVGSVVDVIRGITEQTNLLALNAAIEAARAGDQGRGFAVVADEVRTLATRTRESTHEIQNKIESLQSDAHDAVARMLRNSEGARATIELASKAGTSLGAITSSVSKINAMMAQVASAAEEQFRVAEQISRNVEGMKSLTLDSDSASQAVSTHVSDLGSLAENLSGMVARFKV